MGPKKKETGATFTEVEKTFLELQVAECNRQIARLRTAVKDYEEKNQELQEAYDTLDVDRADIIAYLKKNLSLKNEENTELKDRVKGLEDERDLQNAQFKEKVTDLEKHFTIMKDQLTSENKLLAGKINTLEEFRAIREDLMRKFDAQEQDFKNQELKYKRIIYDGEKKFVIGKDKLKKEMEAKLLNLAQDFQDATELRIAASTHRVIRENIAINNELDQILQTQAKLADQTEKYKESELASRIAKELAEEERDKAINKNVVQLKVIDQLTIAFEEMKKEKALLARRNYDFDILKSKINHLAKENDQLSLQVRILEQNLHGNLSEQNKVLDENHRIKKQSEHLKKILKEAAVAIQSALKLDNWAQVDRTREITDRKILLSRLLSIITQYKEIQRAESMDTIASLGKIYEEGDLGFIPKPVKQKSAVSSQMLPLLSKESVAEVASSTSGTFSTESTESLKTIPSLKVVPISSRPSDKERRDSVLSFVTSVHSSAGEEPAAQEEEADMTDMERQLEASKLEIQKSILKDLAYSQLALQSQQRFSQELEKARESILLEELEDEQIDARVTFDLAEGEHVEGEHVEGEKEGAEEKESSPSEPAEGT